MQAVCPVLHSPSFDRFYHRRTVHSGRVGLFSRRGRYAISICPRPLVQRVPDVVRFQQHWHVAERPVHGSLSKGVPHDLCHGVSDLCREYSIPYLVSTVR